MKIGLGLLILYAILWISLEGRLWQPIMLALGVTMAGFVVVWHRFLGRREYSGYSFLGAIGLTGLFCGFLWGLLTILLMAIKTGLHGHGPEFTPDQIGWVLNQIPLWSAVGLLAGLGIGLLVVGLRKG